jgi:hypothetical protein
MATEEDTNVTERITEGQEQERLRAELQDVRRHRNRAAKQGVTYEGPDPNDEYDRVSARLHEIDSARLVRKQGADAQHERRRADYLKQQNEGKSLSQKTKELRAKYGAKSADGVYVNSYVRSKAQPAQAMREMQEVGGMDGDLRKTRNISKPYTAKKPEGVREVREMREMSEIPAEDKDLENQQVKTQRHPHPSKIEHRKRAARAGEQTLPTGEEGIEEEVQSPISGLNLRDSILRADARSGQNRAAQSAQQPHALRHGETTEDAERRIRNAYKDREVGVAINADSEQIGRARDERRAQGENLPRIPEEREEQHTNMGMQQRMREVTQQAANQRQRVEAANEAQRQKQANQSEEQKSFSQRTKDLRSKYGMKTQRYPHPSKIARKDRADRAQERGENAAVVEDLRRSDVLDQEDIDAHRRELEGIERDVAIARGTGFIPDDDQSAEQYRQNLDQHARGEYMQTLRRIDNRQTGRGYTDR